MTRERLNAIAKMVEIRFRSPPVVSGFNIPPTPTSDDVRDLIAALEAAWKRIDQLERQVTQLGMDYAYDLTLEQVRHDSSKQLTHSMQENWDRSEAENSDLRERVKQLERGEYICTKCGLRKDREATGDADF